MRGELEHVLHPDFTPPNPAHDDRARVASRTTDHAALPPTRRLSVDPARDPADYATEDVTDDGFSGPRSFS